MSPICDIAFVRYQVTDLDRMAAFLADFGLHTVVRTESALYSRAAGPVHHAHIAEIGPENAAVGVGFLARSAEALSKVARQVGSTVEANPEPGGGLRVRFTDPAGFVIDLIHGQATHEALPVRQPLPFNAWTGRKRLGHPAPPVWAMSRCSLPTSLGLWRSIATCWALRRRTPTGPVRRKMSSPPSCTAASASSGPTTTRWHW